jgi:hypothetical protein
MPKMGVNPEETKAPKPVPGGMYEVRIKSFTAKLSKAGKAKGQPQYNYEAYGNVVNNKAEYNDAFVLIRMNNGFNQAKTSNDFAHGLGYPLEADGSFPGDWTVKDPSKPADAFDYFDGAQYSGPLIGKVCKVELSVTNYDGLDRNEVKQILCKVDKCAERYPDIRHLTDWRGKKAA